MLIDIPTEPQSLSIMTLNDCVEFAAKALNLETIAAYLQIRRGDPPIILSAHDQRELQVLRDSALSVIDEIGREYAPLTTVESVRIERPRDIPIFGGGTGFSHIRHVQLSGNVLEVQKSEINGKQVRFKKLADKIVFYDEFPIGTIVTITYKFSPLIIDFTQSLPYEGTRIGVRLIGFGIAAEYCIRSGMTDEAILWDRRYKDALHAAFRLKREARVRARRFK